MDNGHFGENDIMYTFTDYAPNVFNHIRKVYDINNEDYINSIGPNKTMSALILGKMASF
jgi:1-phosphatidylinositol-4-phosphate 5-kinase